MWLPSAAAAAPPPSIPRLILTRVHAIKRPMGRTVNTTDMPCQVFASSAADSGGGVAPCVAATENANTRSIARIKNLIAHSAVASQYHRKTVHLRLLA